MPTYRSSLTGALGAVLGLVSLSAIAGVLVAVTVTPAVALTARAATGAVTIFDNMPSYLEIEQLMLPSTIYARDPETGQDTELASFYTQNRTPVEFDQISPHVFDAVLSSEDPRYYRHGGIDLMGTTRAFLTNFQGGPIQGGSSISQQYVKNVLIQRCEQDAVATADQTRDEVLQSCWLEATNAVGVEGYQRKLQEMRYAVQLEREYSKQEILVEYLNIANFGGTTYGIEAAAQYYYGVSAAELSVGQAAALAGVVQNPNTFRFDRPNGSIADSNGVGYNRAPDGTIEDVNQGTVAGLDQLRADGVITDEQHLHAADGYSATKGRQLYVLSRMLEEGRITSEQHLQASIEPITPAIQPVRTGCTTSSAPFFCQYVVNTIRNDEAYAETFGATPEDRERALMRGGLRIYTTLDPRLQDASQAAMNEYAPETVVGMDFGSSAVSVEATTGRILTMAQNNRLTQDPDLAAADPAYTSLVYAGDQTHGAAGGFATGSTFKLFTLIDWLEQGNSVYDRLDGTVRPISRLENSCDGPWINYGNDTVQNFGEVSGGWGTPMDFAAQSLNSGFLAMAERLDLCDIERVAERMGVTRGNGEPVQVHTASDIIGTNYIAPVTMASAYATVANGGVRCTPHAIERVVDANGADLTVPGGSCEQVISPEVAAAAAHALAGVMRPGGTGSTGNPNDGTAVLGKTGTHEGYHTWLVESSTRVATAVWAGNSIGEDNLFDARYNGMQLSNIRTPLTRDIQRAANELYPAGPFAQASGDLLRRPAPPAPRPTQPDDDGASPEQGTDEGGSPEQGQAPAPDGGQVQVPAPGGGQGQSDQAPGAGQNG